MEQYIVSSNSALELKLGNYNINKKKTNVKMLFSILVYLIFIFIFKFVNLVISMIQK